MFYLIDENNKCYRINANEPMTIGRTASDITLKYYRIGRQHAKISIQNGEVFVEDLKSINGTKINDQDLVANKLTKLDVGSTLNLASAVNLKLQEMDLAVTSAGLKRNEIALLENQLSGIGGSYKPHLQNDCKFMVCNQIEFSLESILALNYNVRFVKPNFFTGLIEALAANKPIPDVKDYFPVIATQFPKTVDRNFFDFNQKRNVLFDGKMFVSDADDAADLVELIETASGIVTTNCDLQSASADNIFMISKTEKSNNLPGNNLTSVTEKDLMLAILFVDCRFLTVRNKHENRAKQPECNETAISISNNRSSLHPIENERFNGSSADVFSSEIAMQTQTKRKRPERTNFVNKKQCSFSVIDHEPLPNSAYTLNILNECYPDISIVKWTLTDN